MPVSSTDSLASAIAQPRCGHGGFTLRDADDGLVRFPYVVGLLAADGTCLAVPATSVVTGAAGTVHATGSAGGFHADLRLEPVGHGRHTAILTVTRTERAPVAAGLRVEVRLGPTDDPGWLVPGVFYGQNRLPGSSRPFPRFAPAGDDDPTGLTAPAWSFRADRCATPAVFARDRRAGAALATGEHGSLGQHGVGFALVDDNHPALRLHAPYREEPVSYYGSERPRPADLPEHRWQPGERHTLTFTLHLLDADPHAYAPVLRTLHTDTARPGEAAAWVGVREAAALSAEGLHRWHYRADPPVLLETAAFDREALGERGDRQAMHVSWVSGAPYAHALLLHAHRTGDAALADAATGVLDHICSHVTPGGTFWGQWTAARGWSAGWTGDPNKLHARTLGDATLFVLRALRAERARGVDHPLWERAARANLRAALRGQDPVTGRLAAAHRADTGGAVDHRGAAGLAFVSALVEAAALFDAPDYLEAARRAGHAYAADVTSEFLCGAPEDVSLAPTSEDGYNAVIAYTLLHEAGDHDGRWLDLARRSADWTLTFRYTYDVRFDPRTLLGRYGFRTRGADQASPSNQHLHAFGLICLPETVRLARHLGDPYYLRSARENLDCFRQFVARADGDFNAYRGMVSERFYQTDCFQAKGMLLTLSHAWSAGVLLYACEHALGLPEFQEEL
ncbi:hypothetical protein AB0O67_01430 [Streptomyces sp. NPDC086077]|uniref:hypothetical protein n=1 Tax=Streptomyces sp. NPDC086077 TaxID=3154862 RepID=UPI00343C81DE